MPVSRELRILILEDMEDDLALVKRELQKAKLRHASKDVATAEAFEEELGAFSPDLILSDYNLPQFDGLSALRMAQRIAPDVPFIFVSGSIGEERAVEVLREGATDYIMKDRMQRLGMAVVRALEDKTARAERLRADAALQKLATETKSILDSAGEGIVGIDPSRSVTLANPAAARMLGCSAEALIGRNFHDVVHKPLPDGAPDASLRCSPECPLRDGIPLTRSSEIFWREDGSSFPVEFTSTPIVQQDGSSSGIVVTFQDVEQQRLLERQLEQANRLSSLGRLAATIAHEFNNVLMGIQPFNDLIRREAQSEKTLKATEQIGRSVQRGKGISGDILRFTRPAPPSRQPINVDDWISNFASEMRGVIGSKAELHVDVPVRGLTILGDPHQLFQVFNNLVLNARDAMKEPGTITLRVSPPSARNTFSFGVIEHPENMIHFTVADTGSGMSAETMQKIFEPLFTTKRTGTGLGLAVCHQIVHHHGGQIFVESEVGKGSAFHVFLMAAD